MQCLVSPEESGSVEGANRRDLKWKFRNRKNIGILLIGLLKLMAKCEAGTREKMLKAQRVVGELSFWSVPSCWEKVKDALWLSSQDVYPVFKSKPLYKLCLAVSKLSKNLFCELG